MRRIIFPLFFLFVFIQANAQNTPKGSFLIKNNKQPNNIEFIEQAISKSNLEAYRLRDSNTILSFENGFQIELIAASAAKANGIELDVYSYNKEYSDGFVLPVFKLAEGGIITAKHKEFKKGQ